MKKIAVLTSGGDAPAMNSAIRAINRRCHNLGIELIGVIGGYKGLYHGNYKKITLEDTAGISSSGGTVLKSSRFVEFQNDDVVIDSIELAKKNGIEAIIVIGGDGSFRGAMALSRLGMPTVALPGTIDNDIAGTQFTIGFNTALKTIVDSIDVLRDTAKSHERCILLEVMGRHCGDLAMYGGMAGDVDMIITNQKEFDFDKLVKTIREAITVNGESIIVVSENVLDTFDLAKKLEIASGFECRATILGYLQRGGKPTAHDRVLATRCGIKSVDALVEGKTSVCTCIQNEELILMDIASALDVNSHKVDIYEANLKLR